MPATAVLSGQPNRSDPPTLASDSSNKYFIAAAAAPPENSSWNKNVLFFRPQAAAVINGNS